MKIRGLLVGVFVIISVLGFEVHAQIFSPVRITATDTSGMQGDSVCVNFVVEEFINIQTIQFSIHFDPRVMIPQCPPSNEDINLLGLGPNNFNCTEIDEGHIKLLWIDPDNGQNCGVTIPDGDNIFSICFQLIGDPGTVSPIYVAGDQLEIEYTQIPDCTKPDSFTLNTNSEILVGNVSILCGSLAVFEGFCDSAPGQNNGSFNFYPCGGTAPYAYSVNGGNFTGTIQNSGESVIVTDLTPGPYQVEITDASGTVVSSNTINIGEQPTIQITTIETLPSCTDRSNGSIEILDISGGTAPYITIWDNFNFNNPVYNRLSNGTYGLTVTDAMGCQVEELIEVMIDTIEVEAQVLVDASCPGAVDGQVQLVARGGNPRPGNEYVYNNNPPIDTFIDNVSGGWYYFQVSDSSVPVCRSDLDSIFINTLGNITTNVVATDISCYGEVDGSVIVTASGSTDFNFSMVDADGNPPTIARSNRTTYECFVMDTGMWVITTQDDILGCIKMDTVFISEPDSLDVSLTSMDPTCNGSDGMIQINATGGTVASDYQITWSDGGAGNIRADLSGGMYIITVEDDRGCFKILESTLLDPINLGLNPSIVQEVTCHDGSDGIMEVATSSSGDFIYRWVLNGDTVNTMQQATGLSPGFYDVIVTDTVLSCSARDTIRLSNPAALDVQVNYTLPSCPFPDFTNGSIGVNVMGGSGTYTYLWDDGSDGSVRGAIAAGDYAVTISDDQGCSVDTLLTLENPDSIQVTVSNIEGVRCKGENSGRARAVATGGTVNNGQYNFFWSSGAVDAASNVSTTNAFNLGAGRQFLVVSDASCPSDTVFFDVADRTQLVLDLDNTIINDPSCFDGCDGNITAAASGGNPTLYSFQWEFNGALTPGINGICAGTYYVNITDNNSCTVRDSIVLDHPDSLEIAIDPATTQDPNCFNTGAAQIGVVAAGGTPVYTYTWSDDVSDGVIASNLADGNYFVTVTDANGCTDVTSYILASPSPIQAIVPNPTAPACFGGTTCVNVTSVSGGSGQNYTFTVNNGPRFAIDSCIQVFAGPYTVTVFDGDGCNEMYNIEVDQPSEINVNAGPDLNISLGEFSESVNVDIDAIFNITDIVWTPQDSLDCLTADCQVVQFGPQTSTNYRVQVIDENGCTAFDEVFVEVSKTRNVFAANIFSPNRDGRNDYFQLTTGAGVSVVREFHVFDRWGTPVWKQENYLPNPDGTDGWDGTIGSHNALPGVYGYVAKVRFIDNAEIVFKGSITLVR